MNLRRIEERFFFTCMIVSLLVVLSSLVIIVSLIVFNGASSLSLEMITQTPTGGYFLGGSGGILNAILGSLFLALPATGLAYLIGMCISLFLQSDFSPSWMSNSIRLFLDVLWGIPSIVYGIFCLMIMIALGFSSSLLAGICALTLLEIPIITRYIDESIKTVPIGLKESSYSLGSTKFETSIKVIQRQALPGILAGVLLGLGRGIGDAASILFTAGFSNNIPTSLFDSTAALPTMIYSLYAQPNPVVREKAYAAAFLLLIIVLIISVVSRLLTRRLTKHVLR